MQVEKNLKEQLTKTSNNNTAVAKKSAQQQVKEVFSSDVVKRKFEEVLGKKSNGFIASVLSLVNTNTNFKNTDPNSIVTCAMQAATFDLPINSNLGFAYIIPYGDVAQFQLGYKGYIQLAMRSGAYKNISAAPLYEGQIKKYNRITGEIEIDFDFVPADKQEPIGYVGYFKLLNGFEKYYYMTKDELISHGKRFSKSYNFLWSKDFNSMALKTVTKLMLSKYGILSVDMQTALLADQAVIKEVNGNIEYEYIDNPNGGAIEVPAEIIDNDESLGI